MPPKLGLAIGIPGKGDDDDDEHNDTLSASFSLGQNGTLKAGSMEIKPDGLTRHGYEHYKISAEHLRTVKTLGTGASSVVHKALLVQENKFVAVKKIKLFEKELRKQMMNDIKALSDATNHPGLVSFFGAFHSPDLGEIAIVLEYMDGGSLADVLRKVKRIPEPHLAHITHRILQGLLELHRRHMVHRDIKPANILMNLKGEAKISDFGISKFFDQTMAMCLTYVGTVTYMSPERIKNQNYSYPADIWSVGLTLIECATGKYPYDATVGPLQLMMEIDASPVPLPPPGHFSEEFRDFVSKCMQKDPQQRPGASELLQHPFIVRYLPMNVDLRSFMKLAVDPNDKLNEVCTTFAFGYYHLLQQGSSAIETMMPLYLDYSKVTYEGDTCEGREAIQGKLQQVVLMHKAFGKVEFDVINVDCQALADGSALLMLQGVMRPVSMPLDSTAFTETFVLRQTQRSEIYVSNQNFRLLPKPH